jgi:hypothetical protein
MTHDNDLHIRLDGPTKCRLQELARERDVSLSDLAREILWERVRDSSVVADDLPGRDPTFPELRERALQRLTERFQRARIDRTEVAQLRWVKACISEIPPLVHADPSRVLFELQLRSGVTSGTPVTTPQERGIV